MLDRSVQGNVVIAARQSEKEREYWKNKLAGELVESRFPFDSKKIEGDSPGTDKLTFEISGELFSKLTWIINESDPLLHMILAAILEMLIRSYTGNHDIIIASPIYKQDIEGDFINTILVLRNRLEKDMTFKELLFQVRDTVNEAVDHQNYPLEAIFYDLNLSPGENDCRLFDTVILLENIHCREYIEHVKWNILLSFRRTEETLEGVIEYKTSRFAKTTIERMASCFLHLAGQVMFNVDMPVAEVEAVPELEKKKLLVEFNDNKIEYPREKTIHELFEEQVEKSPHRTAVVYEDRKLTYRELNRRANRLAWLLRDRNVQPDSIVGFMCQRSLEMIIGIFGILKAGGAYFPIDTSVPVNRLISLLKNSQSSHLLLTDYTIEKYSYMAFLDPEFTKVKYVKTLPRPPISELDLLPFPDRSLVDSEKYNRYIGQALVKNKVVVQGSRGCPFNCAFCHKIWPKKQASRSAENIFKEIRLYYHMGVRRFAFVDDIFNLNVANTTRLFEMIIENRLQVEFFLALRGDILTREYIDLMVRTGTVRVTMSLETASPRLQKLIGKNLNLEKFRQNIEYFCKKYPQVILELNTLHGIPTETQEEANLTLDFIKSLKWVHFPYVHVLKIYQNTDMEKIALRNGISKEAIVRSENLAYHELPETLPFDKGFSKKYQAEFFNDYFLSKERLRHVLPFQMKILTEDEIVQKYDSYVPVDINTFDDLLDFAGIQKNELILKECKAEAEILIPDFNRKLRSAFPKKTPLESALKVLLLDLSQLFSGDKKMLYDIVEPPLGLMYLMSYLHQHLPGKINGKIARPRIDFDNYEELKALLDEFKPDVIGVRTLSFFKEFFHKTIGLIKQWGIEAPIIAGGPYITSDYLTILPDQNIDLLVLGEGEITFCEVIGKMIENDGKLPHEDLLKEIPGIVFASPRENENHPGLDTKIILMDEAIAAYPGKPVTNPVKINQPGDLAYVIFTSGSSGEPKGVMLRHLSVNNLVAGLKERVYNRYPPGLSVSLVAPYVFDASVKQVFGTLLLGHTLYIVPEETRIDGFALRDFYAKHQVEIIDGTPTHLRLLKESIGTGKPDFEAKHFIIGGEAFPYSLAEQMFKIFNSDGNRGIITNVYGPTECCDVSASYDITPANIHGRDTIPIGKPMPNTRAYILDDQGHVQPIGVAGELCIGGDGVARGYLRSKELTLEKFIDNPFEEGELLYKTGDLARWLPDGNIEFVGRKDHQIKIRGFRIEPGEIEKQLMKTGNIKETIVIDRKDEKGDNYLCAYIVPRDGDLKSESPISDSQPFHFEKILKTHKEFSLKDMDIDGDMFISKYLSDYENGEKGESLVRNFEKVVREKGDEVAVKMGMKSLEFISLHRQTNRLARVIAETYDDRFTLNENEQVRYRRQLLLDRWGIESQEKLKSTTVFVAGAGGIGSQIIHQLALIGFGTLIICDDDTVELSNLNRQSMHNESRIGMNKALSAQETIRVLNPNVNVIVRQQRVTRENIHDMLEDSEILFDCVDDLETKFILSEAAVARQIPHILSGMIEVNSFAAILYPPHTPCYHCLNDRSKVDEINEMKKVVKNYRKKPFPVAAPALFTTTGFICNEVLKIVLGFENPAYNKFFLFNQKGSRRIVETEGYKQITFAFNDHLKRISKEQGFDWDICWRGNFVEELTITPDPHCPLCAAPAKGKIKTGTANRWKNRPIQHPSKGNNNRQSVLSLVAPGINSITAVLGVLKAGKIVVPLDFTIPEKKSAYIMEEIGSRLVLTDSENLELALKIRDIVNKRIPVVNLDEVIKDKSISAENLNIDIVPHHTAYILPGFNSKYQDIPLTSPGLKGYLLKELPDYMVPAHFMVIEKIPFTPHGKIDRKALPEPMPAKPGENYEVPKNRVENKLAEIWSEVLAIDIDRISMNSNFFDLGGHSLRATTLIAKINKEFNVRLPLAEIFRTPTIRELAEFMKGTSGEEREALIEPAEKKEYYALTSMQHRLYILQQMEQEGTVYNIPQLVVVEEKLEKAEGIFEKLIQRHESLRTAFVTAAGEPVQRVHDSVPFQIQYHDLNCSMPAAQGETKKLIQKFVRPFDLSRAPLMRVGIITLEDKKSILMVDMHHIISDAVSNSVLIRDINSLHAGEELPRLSLQYKDYSEWLKSPDQAEIVKKQEDFWQKEFEEEIPVLDVPIDYPRPEVQSFEGTVLNFEIDREETKALNNLARSGDATLFMVLLAALNVLFSKISGQEDIVFGTPVAGRRHSDLEQIVGLFINTLPLRNFPSMQKTFKEFLGQVKERTLNAFENQEYQFEDLVEKLVIDRNLSRNPLFDVMFALQNVGSGTGEMSHQEMTYDFENQVSRFDMTWNAIEIGEKLFVNIEYCTQLFKKETIERFTTYFRKVMLSIIAEPDIKLSVIDIVSEEERKQLLYDFNDTGADYPKDKTIHQLFEEQVETTPDHIALVGQSEYEKHSTLCARPCAITYQELNEKSNQLAYRLREQGIQPDTIGGIMMEQSVEIVTGILGILKAGGAYLPVDPEYPVDRISTILAESGAKVLVTTSNLFEERKPGRWEGKKIFLDVGDRLACSVDLAAVISNPQSAAKPGNLSYVIYTSGTTGKPKGVVIEHRALVNLCFWHNRYYQVRESDHATKYAGVGFDASVWELFPYLIRGASLYIIDEEIKLDIHQLNTYFERNRITIAFLPTQMCEKFMTLSNQSLRILLTGGDKLRSYKKRDYQLVNNYGPTENTVVSTRFIVEGFYDNIPIGSPIDNTKLYILDKYHRLQPIGVPGELCISGCGLSRGYLNLSELTAEKFIRIKITGMPVFRNIQPSTSLTIYCTGDLARWLPDGNVEFLGRIDHQVKIRGYRIEVGEIEAQLIKHNEIKETVVVTKADEKEDKYLCAYIVPRDEFTGSELREFLSVNLPDYMIPAYFVPIENIPLTPNGKVDKRALPEPGITVGKKDAFIAPRNEIEEKLSGIWSEVLGIQGDIIGIESNFFNLGGHSLKTTEVISGIYREFGVRVPLIEIFRTPTIRQLAEYIKNAKEETTTIVDDQLVLLKKKPEKAGHLFFIHDGSGEVEGYVELCNRLTIGLNCWGIRAHRLKNHTPMNLSIRDIAREYIEKITNLQPPGHGPYSIAGWSLGGTIAFEVVYQLEKMGEKVLFLSLIDAPGPQEDWKENAVEFNLKSELDWVWEYLPDNEVKEKVKNVSDMNEIWPIIVNHLEENNCPVETIKRLIPDYLAQAIPNYDQLGIPGLIYYLNVDRTLNNTRALYIPSGKINTVLHYFKASQTPGILTESWNDYCLKPIKSYDINGDHFSILRYPDIVDFTKIFERALKFGNQEEDKSF